MMSLDPACGADARHKERITLAAYSPLAVTIFGSTVIHDWVKLHLMSSLLWTRLFYNAHIVVPSRQYVKKLNS
eukprot:12422426-Karenia_brevis.AAC.1